MAKSKTWAKAPSPCISVCKFRDNGHCIGCGMTKPEKKRFKKLDGKAEKKGFLTLLVARLEGAGRLDYWSRMYRRRCARKDRPCPLDKLEGAVVLSPAETARALDKPRKAA